MSEIDANIAKRNVERENRKRELLAEARKARIDWILDTDAATKTQHRITDADEEGGIDGTNDLLKELQACREDILPCAPQIIESMGSGANQNSTALLKQLLEAQNLSWESVSKLTSSSPPAQTKGQETDASLQDAINMAMDPSLKLPDIPDSGHYATFLNTLCEPSSADLVMSLQKFCKTIREAAAVMISTMEQEKEEGSSEGADDATTSSKNDQLNHGASLAKAIRGFLNMTLREMEDHNAFRNYLYPTTIDGDKKTKPTMDAATRDQLQSSLETFVYKKSRPHIDKVLLAGKEVTPNESSGSSTSNTIQTMNELEAQLHEKMFSLQFVTPAHLEISCLKSTVGEERDVDLSYTVRQLQSLHGNNNHSPRQILQSILLAHRGVSVALNQACRNNDGENKSPTPPTSADDVLPTLILATIRAHPPHLLSILRFIEDFAPLPLLRGEAGYAYTNLCGAMQFLREVDLEGHLAEVTLGGMGEGASLCIGPEEFRLGMEECRRKIVIKKAEEEKEEKRRLEGPEGGGPLEAKDEADADLVEEDSTVGRLALEVKITARDIREARSRGETIDLDWAIQQQNKLAWGEGRIEDSNNVAQHHQQQQQYPGTQNHHLPPGVPLLSSRFSRSYSYLAARPEFINLRDLPQLLKEYKLLVHTTETLLNERTVWIESERKRQLKLEREMLERDFVDVIGVEGGNGVEVSNGH